MNNSQRHREQSGNEQVQHAQLRDLLPAYAATILLGQAVIERFRVLARHIETCMECQTTLVQLLDVIEPIYNATLLPIETRTFDLSFLTQSDAKHTLGLTEASKTSNRFIVVLDELLAKLRQRSPSQDQPTALQARAFGTPLIDYEPDAETLDGASMSIQLYLNDHNPERYDLQLALVLPDDRAAPNGFTITVQADEYTWAEHIDDAGVLYAPAIMPRSITKLQIVAEILP